MGIWVVQGCGSGQQKLGTTGNYLKNNTKNSVHNLLQVEHTGSRSCSDSVVYPIINTLNIDYLINACTWLYYRFNKKILFSLVFISGWHRSVKYFSNILPSRGCYKVDEHWFTQTKHTGLAWCPSWLCGFLKDGEIQNWKSCRNNWINYWTNRCSTCLNSRLIII